MGCCGSRPVDVDDSPAAAPAQAGRPTQQHAITSETAINPTSSTARRRTSNLEPQISRQSEETSRSRSHVSLAEHYNLPLQKPKPWASKSRRWTPSSLRRERYEFFETRVTGHREIWGALRQVAESVRENDLATAQGILDAINVTLPTGRLEEGGYDEAGNLYRVPAAVLSDPTNIAPDNEDDVETDTMVGATDLQESAKVIEEDDDLEKDTMPASPTKEEKGKAPLEKDAMRVKCRLSDRGGPDVVVPLGKTQNVGALARLVKDESDVPEHARIRVAYLGRILDERRTLQDQGWKEGQVVNVLISGVFSS
ncbi:uncharacterized protein HMPREF1541_08492 [Cyphellophora europaea CBS 101466]|uniref:Ubiquitin-like domain-containing protein n=1 Tax=Cyphellophora europaea (strain CBS 101466) TaxID=1220924 RepID=W2RIQ3_CYPE1|nr:uncharacterized protein HMPREF1541_08492 [Cyphellophora europaea CBS 101466]ETN36215.1 hypothetical protein HMPREF1541_08492 [Cyphellophora europaea CBS 101466]